MVPGRNVLVLMAAFFNVMNFSIHAGIFTVAILQPIRLHETMVKRRVKCLPLFIRAADDLNAIQNGIPSRVRLLPDGGKIPCPIFRRQIGFGVGDAHIRNSDAHLHDRICRGVKSQNGAARFALRVGCVANRLRCPSFCALKWAVKLRGEIKRVSAVRSADFADVIAGHFISGDGNRTVGANEQRGRRWRGKSKSRHARARRRRQFRFNAVVEFDAIVTGAALSFAWEKSAANWLQFVPGEAPTGPITGMNGMSFRHGTPRPLKCVRLKSSIASSGYQ